MPYRKWLAGLLLWFLILTLFSPIITAAAQNSAAADLINAVNAKRASYGLPPYQVDGNLVAFSQEHAEYIASIGTPTHTHKDGSSPAQDGVFENVAVATILSSDYIVNTIWADALHLSTMVGIRAGYIGAGVASKDGDTYFVIDVRKSESSGPIPTIPPALTQDPSKPGVPAAPASTPIPLVALATVTPRADGAVIHSVGYGQTLWDIALAYGVKIDDIRRLNGIPGSSVAIYAGEKLLIRLPIPASATAYVKTRTAAAKLGSQAPGTETATPSPTSTRTRRPTATTTLTRTPTTYATPTASPTPTQTPIQLPGKQTLGVTLIVICAAGLGAVGWNSFRKK